MSWLPKDTECRLRAKMCLGMDHATSLLTAGRGRVEVRGRPLPAGGHHLPGGGQPRRGRPLPPHAAIAVRRLAATDAADAAEGERKALEVTRDYERS